MYVDHIAFITRQLETITATLPSFCKPLAIEALPAEGTREQYVDIAGASAPMLLLMQPISAGPYTRALEKRGEGLHHIGAITPSVDDVLPKIAQHRLLLHPISLKTYTQKKTIWLCRPGLPFLIELVESDHPVMAQIACTLSVPALPGYIKRIFSNCVLQDAQDDQLRIRVDDKTITFNL